MTGFDRTQVAHDSGTPAHVEGCEEESVSVVVMDIGCLECGQSTELLGVYPDMGSALAAHPGAKNRADMNDARRGDWRGPGVIVAFDIT